MKLRAVPALLVGLTLAVTPSAALAKSGNVASTQALARATDTLVSAARPDIAKGLAAVRTYTNQVAAQCPRVAAGSPENGDSDQLDNEVVGALTVVAYRSAATPIAAFDRAVKGLSWSNGRLTRAVRTFAKKLDGLTKLATPNVCGDVQGWVSSSFATLPASTVQFDKHYYAVDTEAEEVPEILKLVRPYASIGELSTLSRVDRFEAELGEAEAHAVAYYTHLMDSLELNQ
jgi:hypothetical protein